jgi:cellulose synthase/poly-beta-1,6-N-acetylglucosamine synthase-like glycosyltransferase/putative flippase GtrA
MIPVPPRLPMPSVVADGHARPPREPLQAAVGELAGLLRFALVGASGVLVNLLVLAAVLALVPRPVTGGGQAAAETAATQVAVLWNFALAELWVFRGRAGRPGRPLRFAGYWAISIAALAVQLPLAAGLDRLLPVGYVPATGLALVALVVARYALCRVALYGRRRAAVHTMAPARESGGREPFPGASGDQVPAGDGPAGGDASGRHIRRGSTSTRPQGLVMAVLLALIVVSAVAVRTAPLATATAIVALMSSILLVISVLSVSWQAYAWRTPDTFRRTGLTDLDEPKLSFSVLVPARHEEAVLGATLAGIAAMDHPNFEVVVVVGHDDPGTRGVAEAASAGLDVPVEIVTDRHQGKNKPKALNSGLPHCTGDVVMVIDAEDDVQPGLLRLADTAFRRHAADIVQTGVQLVDFDKSWWTGRNVLEYFFWFRSRLHLHAAQRFIPLGGTSVAIRRDLLEHLGGWDETCLAEDCDLGVRGSSIGARVAVVYEPGHTTLEETPPDVRAFFRQRVRWMQGFMQVLAKGDWRQLPTRRQRVQAGIVLGTPLTQSFAALAAPVSAATALLLDAPVLIVLFTFLPLVPTAIGLAFDLVGLGDFGRTYARRIRWRHYFGVIVSLPAYQMLLSSAALWAAVRQVRGKNDWSKTAHVNAHRDVVIDLRESPA